MFDRAVELATRIEKAKKHAHLMNGDPSGSRNQEQDSVHHMNRKPQQAPQKLCYICGNPHALATCHFINAKCPNCGKVGHIRKAYRGKGTDFKASQRKGPPQHGAVHNIEDNDDLTDSSTPAHTHPHKAHATFTQSTLFHLV